MSADQAGCPPDLALERHLLGELAGSSSASWADHLATCPTCQARLQEMKREGAGFMTSPRAQEMRATISRPQARRGPLRAMRIAAVLLPLAAALLLIVFAPRELLTPKGRGVFSLGIEGRAWDGTPIEAGKKIQMLWTSESSGYLAVVGKEPSGKLSLLFPENAGANSAPQVAAGPAQPLGASIVADSSLDGAELILCFSGAPFPPARALEGQCEGEIERLRLRVKAGP